MKLNRCPICHSHLDILALAKDEVTSELLGKLAKLDTLSGTSLMSYLSLFSPAKSSLSADRALRLINEVETLGSGDWQRLAKAMATTVYNIQNKRRDEYANNKAIKPMKNHNYLKQVFDDIPAISDSEQKVVALSPQANISPITTPQPVMIGKTLTAIGVLEQMKNE